jgi:cysteine desulfurase / selenocysteine lyase
MLREFFPVSRNLIYLNHAAVSPLCRPAAEAMQWLAQDGLDWGSVHYDKWLETYEGLRSATAKMVNAAPAEVAIVKNTSEGIATIAMGLDWRSGDKIVAFEDEFPANQYPWRRLEATKGVKIQWLPAPHKSGADLLQQIDEACRGARLLAISFVQFLTGFRADLVKIGEICKRHGVIFFVDAIQGMGAFPMDVRAAHIDALAADGHKWLTGPEGCGVLYISKELQAQVEPVEFGWTNVASHNDYGSRDMTLRPDAGRYECGTLNTIGCYGLRAAMDFLLNTGIEKIAPVVQRLGNQIAEGAIRKGYELHGRRMPETGAGIVSFRKAGIESTAICAKLRENGIITAPRAGWVRASPHFYIEAGEIEKMLELLP